MSHSLPCIICIMSMDFEVGQQHSCIQSWSKLRRDIGIFAGSLCFKLLLTCYTVAIVAISNTHTHTHTHTHVYQPFFHDYPGEPVPETWILLKQETVSDSGISWYICRPAPRSKQITTPVYPTTQFLQAGCPSCRPTNSIRAFKAKQ